MAEARTAQILIRVPPSLKKAAELAAEQDRRSLTALIETLLVDHLRKKGLMPKDKSGRSG